MLYNQPYGVSDPNAAYINGNPSTGTMGSIPPAASIEFDQREIVAVISYANAHALTDYNGAPCAAPSNADLTQLAKAIFGMAHGGPEKALTGVIMYATPGSYTYTPSVGTRAVLVEVLGGGGGGGSSQATGSTQVSSGISGGGAAYARKWITSAFAGVTIVVGARGAAGTTGGAGGTGGTSSFGAIMSCTGGLGGPAGPASPNTNAGGSTTAAGGNPSGGDINVVGQCSQASLYFGQGSTLAGVAGSTIYGMSPIAYGVSTDGAPANGYGAGGTAAVSLSSSPAHNGGIGGPGLVLIWEYA
jgi:hypothetical protein